MILHKSMEHDSTWCKGSCLIKALTDEDASERPTAAPVVASSIQLSDSESPERSVMSSHGL